MEIVGDSEGGGGGGAKKIENQSMVHEAAMVKILWPGGLSL